MSKYYQRACFMLSVPSLRQAPADEGLEVAFAGRSNAGKSSAINTITNIKSLARTSKTPGRTQQLVFFSLDDEHRLVDLPGYGFARVSESVKKKWQQYMTEYLVKRASLQGLIIVMDCRHPLTAYDLDTIDLCRHARLKIHILLTKSDKLTRGAANNTLNAVAGELESLGIEASLQLFSSLKKQGVDDAHEVLDEWLHYPQ
ncbi:MAG TPA: YihA family ribosome biogenesis GTP-binding protein [Gammaproteobacteria bacterium]|nr:YihA family ribosome biogenesis GTP-binding protein [Gammaproteobacteria bacterium]